jgi:hypothetical protein
VTSAGRVVAVRRSMRCDRCGLPAHPADDRLGLEGFLSPGAARLACLAAATWSFAVAADRLEEFCGVRLDDETIRRCVHREAAALADRREAEPPRRAFTEAEGDLEFLTDGVLAPTRGGWRELKLALFLKRPRGNAAAVDAWATRDLPPPAARVAYARLEPCEEFAARWDRWAGGLGLDPASPPTVLGDGAEWIWNAADERFPCAEHVLDIFHASQHIATAADALCGEGTAESAAWLDAGRRRLLERGWSGLMDHVGGTPEPATPAGREALDGMIGYFAKHVGRLGYAARLAAGRSIGSGPIEGLARTMGRRLKTPGRGWLARHVDGIAALVTAVDSPGWDHHWSRPAA